MTRKQQLSQKAIDEFKAIYEEEFGENISDAEAREIALQILRLFSILYPKKTAALTQSTEPTSAI